MQGSEGNCLTLEEAIRDTAIEVKCSCEPLRIGFTVRFGKAVNEL
jgi:hypothetical protein